MSSLSDNAREILKEIFDIYKSLNNGQLPSNKIGDVLRVAGLIPTDEQISNLLKSSPQQLFTFEELCSIYDQLSQNCSGSYEELVESLKVFDKDSTGKIPIDELKHCLTSMGEKLTPEMVDDVLKEVQDNAYVDIYALCDMIAPTYLQYNMVAPTSMTPNQLSRPLHEYLAMPTNEEGKYESDEDLPENLQELLPEHAQHIFREAFNHAVEQYQDPDKRRNKKESPEKIAYKVAWAAVKTKYEKGEDGNWREI